jgi:hypothetical protein
MAIVLLWGPNPDKKCSRFNGWGYGLQDLTCLVLNLEAEVGLVPPHEERDRVAHLSLHSYAIRRPLRDFAGPERASAIRSIPIGDAARIGFST